MPSSRDHSGAGRQPATTLKDWPGRCQANASQCPRSPNLQPLGRQLTPLGQGNRAVLLEAVAAVQVAVVIEVVVDGSLHGGEFLQGLDVPNFAIAPSRRRNGSAEFSARLLSQRPHSRNASLPIAIIAAP